MLRLVGLISTLLVLIISGVQVHSSPSNHDDMYAVNYAGSTADEERVNFPELMKVCNSSFYISQTALDEFTSTGELSDTIDKTGMCYLRCMWEKSGLINDWKLNANKIRTYLWPATGDTLETCAMEGMSDENDCVHLYMIAKCLMLRAIVDAQNKPTV